MKEPWLMLVKFTYIVPSPPKWLCPCLDAVNRLPWRRDIPKLNGAIVTASGELVLIGVTPVQVMDPRHVCSNIPKGC